MILFHNILNADDAHCKKVIAKQVILDMEKKQFWEVLNWTGCKKVNKCRKRKCKKLVKEKINENMESIPEEG